MREPDFTIRNLNGDDALRLWVIFHCRWFQVHLHQIVSVDTQECFHGHPANAIRLILWSGYWEENLELPSWRKSLKRWRPGMIGLVRREHIHRIAAVSNSWSLWFRSNDMREMKLYGSGWRGDEDWEVVRPPAYLTVKLIDSGKLRRSI